MSNHASTTIPAQEQVGTADPKMEIRGVTKSFTSGRKQVQALAECNVSIAKGEFVTIVGPSGCGKSTLMMIAAGLEDATSGEIYVDGRPAGAPGPQRSVVFQKFALFPARPSTRTSSSASKSAESPQQSGRNVSKRSSV